MGGLGLDVLQDERRIAPRLRTWEIGQVVFNDGRSSLDCLVRDLTAMGARLRFGAATLPPSCFELLIRGEDRPVACRVVWQRGMEAGVRFGRTEPDRTVESGSAG